MPLIISLFLFSGNSTIAQATGRNCVSREPIRARGSDYSPALPHGYLAVYLTADEFKNGNAWYFPHSFFAIYTTDGKLFKNVTSQYFGDDETPEVVRLPVGSYMVVARSEKDGYIRLPVAIKAGQRTVLDLDLRQEGTLRRLARN